MNSKYISTCICMNTVNKVFYIILEVLIIYQAWKQITFEEGQMDTTPVGGSRDACSPVRNFEYFQFKSINLMHFERSSRNIRQHEYIIKYTSIHGEIMLYKEWDNFSHEMHNRTTNLPSGLLHWLIHWSLSDSLIVGWPCQLIND